ncbi:DMT family transporter [Candidatus Micrarchaeota archaeon]|nr:DMT family transporter [Candidatus Micrarchaeota archaeon]
MQEFILLGLLAAAGWGVGDFLSARSSRKTNSKHTLFWLMVVAPSLWLAFALATGQLAVPSTNGFLLAFAVGACFYAGDFIFNLSSTKGKIAVASPLLALAGVFAIAFAVFLLGESPTFLQILFGVLAVSGGVLLSLKRFRLAEFESNARIMIPAAAMHGLALTLSKPLFLEVGVANAAFWQYAAASLVFLPLAI